MEVNKVMLLIFLISFLITGLIYFIFYFECDKVNNIQINYDKDINLSNSEVTINSKNNLELNDNTDKKKTVKVKEINYELIFYWANWCGICQKIKPLWKEARKEIESRYNNIKIKEVNCDNPSIDKCHIITDNVKRMLDGVPTILLRYNGKDIEYKKDSNLKGDRSKDDILKFLKINLKN